MPCNIILFQTDQLRADALGCYGNTVCRTPHLDALAGRATRFERAYTVSPVCSPARCSLLTGLYPHRHGVMINTHIAPAFCRGLSPQTPTFSRLLKDAGYALDYVGKWHVHQDLKPDAFGFDRHVWPQAQHRPKPGAQIELKFPGGNVAVASVLENAPEEEWTRRATEAGIELLRQRACEGRPFFLRIDVMAPHFPMCVPERFAGMYDPADIPPWPNFAESFAGKPAGHLRKHREWHLEDKAWSWWAPVVGMYYAAVSMIDECVGRLVQAIHEAGLDENTCLLFTSDHADATGSHRHFEKAGTMYEEVMRIPLLARLPGQQAGRVADAFARNLDLMPTICALGDVSPPAGIDGHSLLPLLRGQVPAAWPDSVYAEHHGEVWGYQSQRMVRTRRYKYVYNPHDLDELYDLERDPAELRNRIDDPSCAGVLGEMKARLLGWNDATADMFKWPWVRWNFPAPVRPEEVTPQRLPLTCET